MFNRIRIVYQIFYSMDTDNTTSLPVHCKNYQMKDFPLQNILSKGFLVESIVVLSTAVNDNMMAEGNV